MNRLTMQFAAMLSCMYLKRCGTSMQYTVKTRVPAPSLKASKQLPMCMLLPLRGKLLPLLPQHPLRLLQ
jgi:hypothetical protein